MGDTSTSLLAMQPKKSAFAISGPEAQSRAGHKATSEHGPPVPACAPSAPGTTGVTFAGLSCPVLSKPVVWSSRFAQDLQAQQQQLAWGKGMSAFKSKTASSYREDDLPAVSPDAVFCATQSSLASLRMAASSSGVSGGKSSYLCSAFAGSIPSPAPLHGTSSSRALVGGPREDTRESSLNLCGSKQQSNPCPDQYISVRVTLTHEQWPVLQHIFKDAVWYMTLKPEP